MSELDGVLDRGLSVASEHPHLAAVPLVTALLAVDKIRRVAELRGTHGGVSFAVPAPIIDVWSFVSVPNQGVSGPDAVPLALLPVFAVVNGLLAAGYLGCIRDALREEDLSFVAGVRRHGAALVGYQLLSAAAVLAFVAPATISPALLVVVVPAVLAAAYLFYGAPYLVVARDQSLVASLEESYRLATGGGAYAALFVSVLVGGAVLSLFATPLVVNLGIPGVVLGAVALAPVGVAVNAATMALFLRLRDGESADSAGGPDPETGATSDAAAPPVGDDEGPRDAAESSPSAESDGAAASAESASGGTGTPADPEAAEPSDGGTADGPETRDG